jgi:hypothetical protein
MELKNKLKELAFNFIGEDEHFFLTDFFQSLEIRNWPNSYSEETEEQEIENFSCVELEENHMLIHCNADWQKPMEIKISCDEEGIFCEESYPIEDPNYSGISDLDFLNTLFDGNAATIFGQIDFDSESATTEPTTPEEILQDEEKRSFEEYLDNENMLPHNDIVRKINEDQTPFSENLFFAYNTPKLGAEEFNRCVDLLMRRNNEREGNPMQTMGLMQELMGDEAPYKDELEELAINLVREMYNVTDSVDLKGMIELRNPEEECDNCAAGGEEFEIDEERKRELQPEIEKRRILNSVVHGCAVHQWTTAYYLVQEELNNLSPDLLNKYNRLSALVNYWNWKIYFEPMFEMGQMPVLQGINNVNIENKEVSASGMNFPVLIHELSKGVMDYLVSVGIPKEVAQKEVTEDELRYIYSEADKYAHEQWHYFFGPTLWRALLDTAEVESQGLPPIISKISKMNYQELASFCVDIIFNPTTSGKEKMEKIKELS